MLCHSIVLTNQSSKPAPFVPANQIIPSSSKLRITPPPFVAKQNMARKKKTPTPSEVELEIECLLSSWADALEIVHDGHKKYQAVLTKKSRYLSKKSKGCSPLTVEDNRILQNVSLRVKYDLYKKYYTLKTKLKKAKKDFESTPVGSSRRELEQRDMGPKKSTMKELLPISRQARSSRYDAFGSVSMIVRQR